MITQELLSYIKSQHDKGVFHDELKNRLVEAGWTTPAIDEAFAQLHISQTSLHLSSPSELSDLPISENQEIIKIKKKVFLSPIILIFVFTLLAGLVIGSLFGIRNTQLSHTLSTEEPGNLATQPFLQKISTSSWKPYAFGDLTFKYPPEWQFKKQKLLTEFISITKQWTSNKFDGSIILIAPLKESQWKNCSGYLKTRKIPQNSTSIKQTSEEGSFKAQPIKGDYLLNQNHADSVGSYKNYYLCFKKGNNEYVIELNEWGEGRSFKGLPILQLIINSIE